MEIKDSFVVYDLNDFEDEDIIGILKKDEKDDVRFAKKEKASVGFAKKVYASCEIDNAPLYTSRHIFVSTYDEDEVNHNCNLFRYNYTWDQVFATQMISYGEETFKELSKENIHFSAAIYDEESDTLLVGGTEPIYYGRTPVFINLMFSNNKKIIEENCIDSYELKSNTYLKIKEYSKKNDNTIDIYSFNGKLIDSNRINPNTEEVKIKEMEQSFVFYNGITIKEKDIEDVLSKTSIKPIEVKMENNGVVPFILGKAVEKSSLEKDLGPTEYLLKYFVGDYYMDEEYDLALKELTLQEKLTPLEKENIFSLIYMNYKDAMFKELHEIPFHYCGVIYDGVKDILIAGTSHGENIFSDNPDVGLFYGFTQNYEIMISNNKSIIEKFCIDCNKIEDATYLKISNFRKSLDEFKYEIYDHNGNGIKEIRIDKKLGITSEYPLEGVTDSNYSKVIDNDKLKTSSALNDSQKIDFQAIREAFPHIPTDDYEMAQMLEAQGNTNTTPNNQSEDKANLLLEEIRKANKSIDSNVDEKVKEKIMSIIEKYFKSKSLHNEIKSRTHNIMSNELEKELLSKIKEMLESDALNKDLEKQMEEKFNKMIEEHTSKLSLPVNYTIKLNDTVIGQTGEGFYHEKFEEVLEYINLDEPVMLIGPAGSGKNHMIGQIAKALNTQMYYTNDASNEFKLTGFIDAGGNYRETEFYKAFKNGGIFLLDEIDASDPSALIVINSALANGYMAFPHETIDKHPNFRMVSAANTWGKGSDLQYVGRNALDASTLDRYDNVFVDYDRNLEKGLYPNEEVLEFMWSFRDSIEESRIPHIVSTRGIGKVYKKEINGFPVDRILRVNVVKNLSQDDLNIIIGGMKDISSANKYLEAAKRLDLKK